MTGFQQQELKNIYSLLKIIKLSNLRYSYIYQDIWFMYQIMNTHLFDKQRPGKDHKGVTKFNLSSFSNDINA